MTKPDSTKQDNPSLFAKSCGVVTRGICALACFPHEAVEQLRDWRAKVDVLSRGLAVVIGPTIGGIALFTYAGAVFGNAPFIFLLPFIALLIDWRITGAAYDGNAHKHLNTMRLGLALISCLVAAYASLVSEQPNLLQAMRAAETKELVQGRTVASSQYARLEEQLAQASALIAANENRLQRERPVIAARLSRAQMLYQKECSAAPGTDASTGIRVVGGRCGQRAAGHKAEADAARRELGEVDQLPGQNDNLRRQVLDLQRQQQAILETHLTATASVGALFKSIQYADVGTWIAVGGRLVVLVFCELLCLVLAKIQPPQNVIDAVTDLSERDARRLELLHASSLAELNRNVPPVIFTVDEGDSLQRANATDEAACKVVPISLAHVGARA